MIDRHQPGPEWDSVASAEYDWAAVTPTTAIAELVADVEGVDPAELESLYRYVDPDALESLLARDPGTPTGIRVRFRFDGYLVSVQSDGSLALFE